MLFMVEASAASALAVTGLLLYISVRFRSPSVDSMHIDIHHNIHHSVVLSRSNEVPHEGGLTETHVHYYFLNLLLCDFILSVGM